MFVVSTSRKKTAVGYITIYSCSYNKESKKTHTTSGLKNVSRQAVAYLASIHKGTAWERRQQHKRPSLIISNYNKYMCPLVVNETLITLSEARSFLHYIRRIMSWLLGGINNSLFLRSRATINIPDQVFLNPSLIDINRWRYCHT